MSLPTKRGQAAALALGEVEDNVGVGAAMRGYRRVVAREEAAHVRRREIAGDAKKPEAVATVRRQLELDDRPFEPERLHGRHTDLEPIRWEVDDAGMVLADAELARRAKHALALDAANGGPLQDVTGGGNGRPFGRNDAPEARSRIGRATDDLFRAVLGLDGADAQPLRIRVLVRLAHIAHGEGGQRRGRILDALDLEAQGCELLRDRLGRAVGLEMLLEPGQRDLHRDSPP